MSDPDYPVTLSCMHHTDNQLQNKRSVLFFILQAGSYSNTSLEAEQMATNLGFFAAFWDIGHVIISRSRH